mgnify:FL=1
MGTLIVLDVAKKIVYQRHDELHKNGFLFPVLINNEGPDLIGVIKSVQFSPSGRYICTTGTEGGARIIDFIGNRVTKAFSLLDQCISE